MFENTRPFRIDPFQITSHRPRFTNYDTSGNPVEPIGYVTRADDLSNYDQESSGGNWYNNVYLSESIEGNGRVIIEDKDMGLTFHPPESWTDPIDDENEKDTYMRYGLVHIYLTLSDRWEDHIPFKEVKFTWKIKKQTIQTMQIWDLVPPSPPSKPYWTSTPGEILETQNFDEEVTIEFQMPDDFEEGKHDFVSYTHLTEQQQVDRGFVYPGKEGETFHDGSDKYGYDREKDEREYRLYLYDPNFPEIKYRVLTKITVTSVRYLTDFNGGDVVVETSTPSAFFNQE